MKATITLIYILLFSYSLQAQIVNIPDVNFKAALLADPSINTTFDGNIEESEAANYAGSINVSGLNIADLTGIEAFTNITSLNWTCYI
ncbi:MAG: hypothetical protein HRT71_01880 [Flavobacteriales bacterium]|nr:hypothetical protein [Flavobacteriales bacterium]